MKRVNDDPYYPDFSDLDEIARRRPSKPTQHELRLIPKLYEAIDRMRGSKPNQVPRPKRGRPSEFPTAAFCAFILVNNEMNVYRHRFGVNRVPEAETDKFIGYAMRVYPDAKRRRYVGIFATIAGCCPAQHDQRLSYRFIGTTILLGSVKLKLHQHCKWSNSHD